MPTQVLIVVSNPSVSTTLGVPVGFWISELVHPYQAFVEAGYEVVIASPKGGKVEVDGYSDPRDPSGYSAHDILSLGFLTSPKHAKLLENTPAVSTINPSDFDSILIAGGQGPMFTFRHNEVLANTFRGFYNAGKVTAVLCHGTCMLIDLKDENGEPFVRGRTVTGFANSEEDYADHVVGRKVMPFRIEDELRALGANYLCKRSFMPFAVRDGNLITGQQQNSGRETAMLVIEALGAAEPAGAHATTEVRDLVGAQA